MCPIVARLVRNPPPLLEAAAPTLRRTAPVVRETDPPARIRRGQVGRVFPQRPLGEASFVREDGVVEGHEDGADQGQRRREQEPLVGVDEGGVHGPNDAPDDN